MYTKMALLKSQIISIKEMKYVTHVYQHSSHFLGGILLAWLEILRNEFFLAFYTSNYVS
jgi:hypothetical protein